MKKLQYCAVVFVAGWLGSSLEGHGQTGAPTEHLKVENGFVLDILPGQAWKTVGPATLGTAVKALGEIYPQVTIAIDPKLVSVQISDLTVRSDNPRADLEALEAACGEVFNLRNTSPSIFALTANNRLDISKHDDREIQVFNLSGYLQQVGKKGETNIDLSVELLQAIISDSVKAMDDKLTAPHFKFYRDANLLIVIGSEAANEVAQKVINALPGQEGPWFHNFGSMNHSSGSGYSYGFGRAVAPGLDEAIAPIGAAPAAPASPPAARP